MKLIPIDDDDDDEALREVQREVDILQSCDHANVVKYYGTYRDDKHLWIAMEYCDGNSLADIMEILERPLTEEEIAAVMRDALLGLAYIHGVYKIHRDIKAGNILLKRGQVKLADFGVSAQLTSTMNRRNTFVGTPFWMSPEVIKEERYDGRADVWSIGITAIELAEGAPPRSNVHPMRVLFLIPKDVPPQLQQSHWTPAFQDFIAKCLVKNQKHRSTAAQLLQHPFITGAVGSAGVLEELAQAAGECSTKFFNKYDSSTVGQYQTAIGPGAAPPTDVLGTVAAMPDVAGTIAMRHADNTTVYVPGFMEMLKDDACETGLGAIAARHCQNLPVVSALSVPLEATFGGIDGEDVVDRGKAGRLEEVVGRVEHRIPDDVDNLIREAAALEYSANYAAKDQQGRVQAARDAAGWMSTVRAVLQS